MCLHACESLNWAKDEVGLQSIFKLLKNAVKIFKLQQAVDPASDRTEWSNSFSADITIIMDYYLK